MPAESKNKQLVLALLRTGKSSSSPSQIARKLEKRDKNSINLIRHYLLDFWRKGVLIRSEREIALEYYYFFGKNEQKFSLHHQKVLFRRYQKEFNSRDLKKRILEIIEQKGPLTVKEICQALKPRFDLPFLKKINFHLRDLYLQKQVLRSSKPYQYHLHRKEEKNISETKASVPTLLLSIITKKKAALFTSELIKEIEQKGVLVNLSTVSVALKRLCRQQKIVSSKTQFGTRSSKTGYLWALQQKEIVDRFWKELPIEAQELLRQDQVPIREICNVLKLSPVNALRWMRRISAELPQFVFDSEKRILQKNVT